MSEQITLINPKNSKYSCSGCDYLCSLLTASDAPEPNTCAIFCIHGAKSKWRKIS